MKNNCRSFFSLFIIEKSSFFLIKSKCLCNHVFSLIHITFWCRYFCVHLNIIEKSWFLRLIASKILTIWFKTEFSSHYITNHWNWTRKKQFKKVFWKRRRQLKIKLNTHLLISINYSKKKWTIDKFVVKSICVMWLRWTIFNLNQKHDKYYLYFRRQRNDVIIAITFKIRHRF